LPFSRRVRSRKLPYGYGRSEDLAGLGILVSIAASAIMVGYESIRTLINPEPMDYLGWVAVAAVVGFISNEAVAILQARSSRRCCRLIILFVSRDGHGQLARG
jgi:divalent metal cation (Fe/Co/Zn/Cd) transporter